MNQYSVNTCFQIGNVGTGAGINNLGTLYEHSAQPPEAEDICADQGVI
jgi:hypothetical protein